MFIICCWQHVNSNLTIYCRQLWFRFSSLKDTSAGHVISVLLTSHWLFICRSVSCTSALLIKTAQITTIFQHAFPSFHLWSNPTSLLTVMEMKHSLVKNHSGSPLLRIRRKSRDLPVKGAIRGRSGAMFGPGGAQISHDDGKWSGSVSPSEALIKGNGSQRPRAGMIAHAVNPTKAMSCVSVCGCACMCVHVGVCDESAS